MDFLMLRRAEKQRGALWGGTSTEPQGLHFKQTPPTGWLTAPHRPQTFACVFLNTEKVSKQASLRGLAGGEVGMDLGSPSNLPPSYS